MQITQGHEQFNTIDLFLLPNGKIDVFLRRNMTEGVDEEGLIVYFAEEQYFQAEDITKEEIESNFSEFWDKSEIIIQVITSDEKIKSLEADNAKLLEKTIRIDQTSSDASQSAQDLLELLITMEVI